MRLAHKFLVTNALIAGFGGVVAWQGYQGMRTTEVEYSRVVRETLPVVRALEELRFSALRIGTAERLGERYWAEYDDPGVLTGWGSGMGWVLRLVETGVDGSSRSVDVMTIECPGDLSDIAALGLTLSQGKQLVALVQQAIVTAQSRDHAARRPECRTCTIPCQVKDYRPHQIATLFGQVVLRLPRFRCADCGGAEAGHGWPAHCRSTPELDQLRAQFSALMPYRVAAGVLELLLPIDAGTDPETLRACTLKVGEDLRDAAPAETATAAAAITLTLDSTFIRSCEDGQRHLEVRLGNVETSDGGRQVFAAVAKTDTSIEALIQRCLKEVGQTADTELTAFTDESIRNRGALARLS